MLENLHVKNLALIDETEVEFGPGLNILTGETGAGKSILLGSVQLALGGKYSADLLRSGAKSGLVELTFTIEDEKIKKRLEEMDIEAEDGAITLSRKLTEGRSVCRINGETVNMGTLKDAAGLLIDIHGQHDSQSLLQRRNHLALLDLYGKEEIYLLKKEMAAVYKEYQELVKKRDASSLNAESRARELELVRYEVSEIEDAAPVPGEDDDLEELYRRMTQSRKVAEAVSEAYRYTAEDARGNASDLLSRAIRALQDISDIDSQGEKLYGQLSDIDSLLNDFNRELAEYAKSFEFSEEEFRETEERLNLINHLKAKYGKTIPDVLEYCEEKKRRIAELEDYDAFIAGIRTETDAAEKRASEAASRLSRAREKAAETFSKEIREQMAELNFMDTRLELRLSRLDRYTSGGSDEAEFYLATNPGEPMKPLENIASGGELSRVMLAVKAVLAGEEDTPTLIFDEIDAGISGVTAGKVGEKLHLIAENRQVICITHLPQIAAVADFHYLIQKETDGNTVKTKITSLNDETSIQELARMLGGANVTGNILESAREMKELAKRER